MTSKDELYAEGIEVSPGHIFQINPEYDDVFGGCLLITTKVRNWGVEGYFDTPGNDQTFYRCKYENMDLVGSVIWRRLDPKTSEDETEHLEDECLKPIS